MSIANPLFQRWRMLWRPLGPKRPASMDLDDHYPWILSEIASAAKFSRLFGLPIVVIFGDSNGFTIGTVRELSQFRGITLNISLPGSTAFEWLAFLKGAKGSYVLHALKELRTKNVGNLGGNHALQLRMEGGKEAMHEVAAMVPNSWWINVPPLPSQVIDFYKPFNPNLKRDINTVNRWVATMAGERLIDIAAAYAVFQGATGIEDAHILASSDGIHYADWFDLRVRIPAIREAIGD